MKYRFPGKATNRRLIIEILYKQGPLHYTAIGELIEREDYRNVASLCANLTHWPHHWLTRTERGTYDLTPAFRLAYGEVRDE